MIRDVSHLLAQVILVGFCLMMFFRVMIFWIILIFRLMECIWLKIVLVEASQIVVGITVYGFEFIR